MLIVFIVPHSAIIERWPDVLDGRLRIRSDGFGDEFGDDYTLIVPAPFWLTLAPDVQGPLTPTSIVSLDILAVSDTSETSEVLLASSLSYPSTPIASPTHVSFSEL